ncbi:MAG: protein translocase subunit SecF [Pseudobdellovibrionaceae bacterium]
MMHFIPTNLEIDFLKISKPYIIASTVAMFLTIIGFFTVGVNYGIDFTGGAEVTVQVPKDWDIGKLRSTIEQGGLHNASVVQIGTDAELPQFLVKIQAKPEELSKISEDVEKILTATNSGAQILKSDVVGPSAGDRLKRSALLSLFYAALGILIYITLRFDLRFAPGIVRALLFDVILVVGVWILLRKEFTLSTVAALLTIAGYSCNDTIVIYDRIREYTKMHPDWSLERAINRSINLNLERTITTTLATCLVVTSLWLLGGPVLADFAFAMLVGFLLAVFSTLFLANPMVLWMEKRRLARQQGLRPSSAT